MTTDVKTPEAKVLLDQKAAYKNIRGGKQKKNTIKKHYLATLGSPYIVRGP